ncbi:unnamed protein product [Calicophoron daubneyi]|uniref:DNA excision repair protein ERCC-8 n=1 Tax=Calicophoron daubneyi TaxID=300641 RepID=A0AAV2TP15_CALDB
MTFAPSYLSRELGWHRTVPLWKNISPEIFGLDVDYDQCFQTTASGPIRDIVLDELECSYLLAGFHDGSLVLFSVNSDSNTYSQLAHVRGSAKMDPYSKRSQRTSLVTCMEWYPVDSGLFFTASVDKCIRIWDTSRMECVDAIELLESISWISLSRCATSHNLVAASMGPAGDGRTLLVDPIIGAVAITLAGGHSHPGSSTVSWSPRASHSVFTGGYDGRILLWDIRFPTTPMHSLDKYNNPDNTAYIPDAAAHTGPVLSLSFTQDGLHLISWGGAGSSEDSLCLRMWSSGQGDGDMPYISDTSNTKTFPGPQLRPINFGIMYAEAQGRSSDADLTHSATGASGTNRVQPPTAPSRPSVSSIKHIPVRIANAPGVPGNAWGGQSAFIFVPHRNRLLISSATRQGVQNRLISRHHAKMRACVWNNRSKELYTCGMDGNLFVWPLHPDEIREDVSADLALARDS